MSTILRACIVTLLAASTTIIAIVQAGGAEAGSPTCSTTLGIAHHGEHIIGDYVIGTDGTGPGGGEGVETRGGPGPGAHFPGGVAPGASFCLSQSRSPGAHPGP